MTIDINNLDKLGKETKFKCINCGAKYSTYGNKICVYMCHCGQENNPFERSSKIAHDIVVHKMVYENYATPIPPYRITPREHKDLLRYLKPFSEDKGLIANYYGVDLQLVVEVEDYM